MLYDRAKIEVQAGAGGDGSVSFRREAHVPRGGPDGGDGGRGGDVVLLCDESLRDLHQLKRRPHRRAKRGGHGEGALRHGARGEDLIVTVPPGTQAVGEGGDLDGRSYDLVRPGQRAVVARGGSGGRGNKHFATPTRQAPRFAERGLPGEDGALRLQLKLLADVGLVGLPNAGKSSLLSRLTRAAPKIGDYPFTTLEPVLGVLDDGERQLVIADIPGLIEGASEGAGLGHDFLGHVERCRLLVHVLDLAPPGAVSPGERGAVSPRQPGTVSPGQPGAASPGQRGASTEGGRFECQGRQLTDEPDELGAGRGKGGRFECQGRQLTDEPDELGASRGKDGRFECQGRQLTDELHELGAGLAQSYETIERELAAYDERLARLPRILVLSKADLVPTDRAERMVVEWSRRLGGDVPVVATSSATGSGVRELGTLLMRRAVEGEPSYDDGRLVVGAAASTRAVSTHALSPRLAGDGHGADAAVSPGEVSELAEHIVYRPGGDAGFTVERLGPSSFAVRGHGIERLVARFDAENEEAMAHLESRLRRIGVIAALEAAGFVAGDEVTIGEAVFELDPELSG